MNGNERPVWRSNASAPSRSRTLAGWTTIPSIRPRPMTCGVEGGRGGIAPFPVPAHQTGRADLSGSAAIAGFCPHDPETGYVDADCSDQVAEIACRRGGPYVSRRFRALAVNDRRAGGSPLVRR
jgi:hypothetical protein